MRISGLEMAGDWKEIEDLLQINNLRLNNRIYFDI